MGRSWIGVGRARARIAEFQHLNAFISLTSEDGGGPAVAVKDLIDVRGVATTGGGRLLGPAPAADDAPLIARMRRREAVVVGKTNLHEWGAGVTSLNPHYGPVLNPRAPGRMAGGSSGGSAVAVAAGMCDWAIGTDTGGSIRIPAALCGVVGFKPTFGTVDTRGVWPLSQSLDTVGPLAPDVESVAYALEAISDLEISRPSSSPASDAVLRLATPADWVDGLDVDTGRVWARVAGGLPQVVLPDRRLLTDAALAILHVEAAVNHEQWLVSRRHEYGPDVQSFLDRGGTISGVEYRRALVQKEAFREIVELALAGWDALILPTTACVAPALTRQDVREPLTRFTRPFNLTGHPVIVLPGPTKGLPVGVQLIGHWRQDAALLAVAMTLEHAWEQSS